MSSHPDHGPVQERAGEDSHSTVDARGSTGVQVGEGNTQIIYTYNRLTWTDGVAPPPLISISGALGSPYRGLSAFEERDAAFFFGRDAATTQVLELMSRLLQGAGLLVVSGVSGAGKSSLLRAGVLPRIRGAGLASAPDVASWPCLLFTPTRAPLDELALRVAVLAGADAADVRRGLGADPAGFALTARQAALARPPGPAGDPGDREAGRQLPPQRLLLVVDQFEQVFTLCSDERQRRAFITALHAAASPGHGADQAPAAMVVLGVRADFEARCANYPQLSGAVQDRYLVTAMTERQLRLAITEPARKAGSRVGDDLVEVLLSDVRTRQPGAAGAGVLPLLSHALDQAWRSRTGEALTLADYERTGGIEGAVADSAQRAYDQLTPAQQAGARQVFTRLTAISAEGQDTADRATRAELAEGNSAAGLQDVDAVLEAFAAERLLTLSADSVEISHEILLAAWPLLRDTWLSETHADRIVRTRLNSTAAEWVRHSRDPSYLYGGSLLQAAAETAALVGADPARHPPLSQAERDFLAASSRAAARISRWRRMLAGVLAVLLVASVTAAGFALAAARNASRQQRVATSRLLISQAEAARDTSPRLALLLGIAAEAVHPGAEAQSSLIGTLTITRYAGTLSGYRGDVNSVAFSPDRRTLATLSIASMRTSTGGSSSSVSSSGGGSSGGGSSPSSGNSAASSTTVINGSAITMWDLSDPARPRRLGASLFLANVTTPHLLGFSPDGRLLATGGADGRTVTLWDVSHPAKPIRRGSSAARGTADVESAAFSPDGRTLATGDDDKTVSLWDVSDPARITRLGAPLTGSTAPVDSVAFSPRGHLLATGSDSDTEDSVMLWDVSNLAHPARLGSPLAGRSPVEFSPTGHLLATHNQGSPHNNNSFVLWNIADPHRPARIGRPLSGNNSAVAFSPDGHTAATAGFDGATVLWDIADPAQPVRSGSPLTGHTDFVLSVAFSPDGRTLATGSRDKTAILWNLTDTARPARRGPALAGADSMAFLPGQRALASGNTHGQVRLWDVSAAARPARRGQPLTGVRSLLSPDGRSLAILGTDGAVTMWDVSDPAHPVRRGPPLSGSGTPALFSPDGRILITGNSSKSMLWDLSDPGQPVRRGPDLPAVIVLVAAFSPDGKTLAVSDIYDFDGKVTLWDVSHPARPTAKRVPVVVGGLANVTSVAFFPGGNLLATGRSDGTTVLWDISDQARPTRIGQPLVGPADPNDSGGSSLSSTTAVLATAFSADRRTMATTYKDKTIILWDISNPSTPRQLGPPLTLTGQELFTAKFSPDGNTLATISFDNTLTLWNLHGIKNLQGHAVERACAITGRGLSRTEWARYIPEVPYQKACA